MIAETLYNVAKDLFGIFTTLDEKRLQRQIRVAEYFGHLAQIIEDTSAYLKKGVYPHGECAELRFYAEKMEERIGDVIGESDAQHYAGLVLNVWEIEQMHSELLSADAIEREAKLHQLDEAAGFFRAVAAHLRVSG